jgi:hypothetical protein
MMFRKHEQETSAAPDTIAARTLGLISIGIGLTEICCPRRLEKTMGINNGQTTGIFRVLGIREICHGIDILSHPDPAPGVWSRVFGDVLDGALLGIAGAKTRKPGGFAAIAAMVLPVVVADLIFAKRLSAQR